MSYKKTTWTDYEVSEDGTVTGGTPLSQTYLNYMEAGIEKANRSCLILFEDSEGYLCAKGADEDEDGEVCLTNPDGETDADDEEDDDEDGE